MIEINLLPHREAKRAADLRQTVAILLLGLLLEGGLIMYLDRGADQKLATSQSQVRQLEQDIEQYRPQEAKVEEFKKTRAQVEDKLAVIEGLDKGRTGPIRLLDELALHTPDRLWITSLTTAGAAITMEGESLDTGMVADFLRALNESKYFTEVDLDKTSRGKEVEGVKLVTFVITAQLTRPADPVEDQDA